jgi:hypothetical protein
MSIVVISNHRTREELVLTKKAILYSEAGSQPNYGIQVRILPKNIGFKSST